MQRAIMVLAVAVIGFGIYGVAVDSPFVYYYVPITVVLAFVVGWIHRTARFTDSTLMALALAAIGNLAGGVLLVGDGPLYGAPVIGSIRYDKVFHALATGVAGWASYEAVKRWGVARTGAAVFVAIMMAGGAGAFVEIIEYVGSVDVREHQRGRLRQQHAGSGRQYRWISRRRGVGCKVPRPGLR